MCASHSHKTIRQTREKPSVQHSCTVQAAVLQKVVAAFGITIFPLNAHCAKPSQVGAVLICALKWIFSRKNKSSSILYYQKNHMQKFFGNEIITERAPLLHRSGASEGGRGDDKLDHRLWGVKRVGGHAWDKQTAGKTFLTRKKFLTQKLLVQIVLTRTIRTEFSDRNKKTKNRKTILRQKFWSVVH